MSEESPHASEPRPRRKGHTDAVPGGVVVVLLLLGLFLLLTGCNKKTTETSGATSGATDATGTTSATSATTPTTSVSGPTIPPTTRAIVESILDAWGVTDPASRQAVLDSLLPVEDVDVGQGSVPVPDVPDFLLPTYHGSAQVTGAGGKYQVFVTEAAAPADVAGLEVGLGYARAGSALSQPQTEPIDFLGTFPQSSFYYFDTTSDSGDLTLLDPVNGWAAVPTEGTFAVSGDVVAMLIPFEELDPGGDYGMQMFFRSTPDGAQPSDADPTAWSWWTRTIEQ